VGASRVDRVSCWGGVEGGEGAGGVGRVTWHGAGGLFGRLHG